MHALSTLIRFGFVSCLLFIIPLRFASSSSSHTPLLLSSSSSSSLLLDKRHRVDPSSLTKLSPPTPPVSPPAASLHLLFPHLLSPCFPSAFLPSHLSTLERFSHRPLLKSPLSQPSLTTLLAACARAFRHLTDSARVQGPIPKPPAQPPSTRPASGSGPRGPQLTSYASYASDANDARPKRRNVVSLVEPAGLKLAQTRKQSQACS